MTVAQILRATVAAAGRIRPRTENRRFGGEGICRIETIRSEPI